MKKRIVVVLSFLLSQIGFSQENDVLVFTEFLGYVKKYHPIVKQANLIINESEAKLLKARGSFDPKLEVDYDRKKFKGSEYYDKLNAAFSIPTWYGIELVGNFDQNTGLFLTPEATVPEDGLYNVGVSVPLAKGLLINERMATLKQAKIYLKQAEAENQLLVNTILFEAAKSYFQWLKTYQDKKVYEEFLNNADIRLKGIIRSYEVGERPAIDTTEARIALNSRKLNLEKARLTFTKASLALSNFLWINDVPVEVNSNLIPDSDITTYIDEALQITNNALTQDLQNNPKLRSLEYKSQGMDIERRLKQNNLLPKIDLKYNFLSETPQLINSFSPANYTAGLNVRLPLFLRKERSELKLTNYKLQEIDFELQNTSVKLQNKINTVQQEIRSYTDQIGIADTIVTDYIILVKGEERKFEIGESSLFLVNSRESKLIENKLKLIELENKLLNAKGKLFNIFGIEL